MSRTTVGLGNVVAGQVDIFAAPLAAYQNPGTVPGAIYCHGATHIAYNATDPVNYFAEYAIFDALRQQYCVGMGDFEFTAWGNDATIADVLAFQTLMQSPPDFTRPQAKSGKFVLAGTSMGVAVALNYALAHPANVACVVGFIPAVDARSNAGFTSTLDAAFPPSFNDSVNGPTHIPVEYAATFPNIPVLLYYSTADTTALPSAVEAFDAACASCTAIICSTTGGHNQPTIATAPIADILAFIAANLS